MKISRWFRSFPRENFVKHGILFKTTAVSLALSIALSPTVSWSGGWVDDWIQQKSSTSPSYYEGSKRGYYTGGSFSARWPNSNDFLVSASLPKLKSGCGGIDMFMGGFSFMNTDYLVQKLQNILAAAPAAAFDIALKTLAPQVADTINTLEAIVDRLNGLQLNDCKAAKALVATAASPFSSVMNGAMQAEIKTAQTDFMVSSGAKDLYQDVSKSFESLGKSFLGSAPAPGTNAINQAASGATAGCPTEIVQIFGSGSVLENLASKKGMSSEHAKLMRGFIGDVIISSPSSTGTTYSAKYIPPCDANRNYDSFLTGTAQGRDSLGGACTTISDTNKNLITFVSNNMQSIATKIKSKTALTATEEAFLQATPMSVSLILKNAVATNTETEIIGKLSEVTAKAFSFYMLSDLLGRTYQLNELARHIRSTQKDNKSGSSPETCQMEILEGGMALVDMLEENTLKLVSSARSEYASVAAEINAVESIVQNMKRFDDTVFNELSKRFGSGVAMRAAGKI